MCVCDLMCRVNDYYLVESGHNVSNDVFGLILYGIVDVDNGLENGEFWNKSSTENSIAFTKETILLFFLGIITIRFEAVLLSRRKFSCSYAHWFRAAIRIGLAKVFFTQFTRWYHCDNSTTTKNLLIPTTYLKNILYLR